ncbi:hypothetical protein HHI36_011933 [Cryptolaemus montrouzieri]|uniref:DNA-directed DNA polymerase family A palm domain-containing protein n=1 Tax=Cryptolaemus montrouzieri TaxID=559131 RepID=A0ABD2NDT8_9CUCU
MSPRRHLKKDHVNVPKLLSIPKKTNMKEISGLFTQGTLVHEMSLGSLSEEDLFHESLEETIDKVSCLTVDGKKRISEPNNSPCVKKQKIEHIYNKKEEFKETLNVSAIKDRTLNSTDLSKFYLIEVCKYQKLCESFFEELLTQSEIALSLACSEIKETVPKIGINIKRSCATNYKYFYQNKKVDGIAFTWDGKNIFYLRLEEDGCHEKIEILQQYLAKKDNCVKIFDSKESVVMFSKALEIEFSSKIQDPRVFDWLLEPDGREKNLHSMISKYCPEAKGLSMIIENCKEYGSVGMNVENTIEPKLRSAVEAMVTWSLMNVMKDLLTDLPKDFSYVYEIEMAATLSISKMEIAGIGIDITALESLISSIKLNASTIEKKIYSLAGKKFSLTSSKEVARVIGLGTSRKVSMKKQTLEQSKHPISDLILLWRKLSCTLSRMLQPLLGIVKDNRIYGKCIMHTSTGRISMHEPNLQNVAKDFNFINPMTNKEVLISCRSIFVPREGCVFLSADYCQLELRMLAHLSKDDLLGKILNSEGDIFKSIAAKWNHITEDLVTDVLRTQTKQICYGIIYGIGSKALGEQLKIEADEAAVFMENFKNTYPGIKTFVENIIISCRSNGFVETLSGRRRHLPLIEDDNPAIKSHAERQAVNSTIQGSAADLVKISMKKIEETFNNCLESKEHPLLVLHLHDELLFEVQKERLAKIARLVKESMEKSVCLSVPFPVKIKTGNSWASLMEQCDIY